MSIRVEPAFWNSALGPDGDGYAYPPGWGIPGFFEAWHEGNEIVRKVFPEQMLDWYPAIRQAD